MIRSKLQLSERLQALADMVGPDCSCVADIGTDHAHLPIWLIQNGYCKSAIATDLREGPAQRARQNIRRCGLSDRIDVRVGDGLAPLMREATDAIVIAGMGGLEMIRILTKACTTGLNPGQLLILQPQRSLAELRQYLFANRFSFVDETVVRERRHLYTIIKVHTPFAESNPTLVQSWQYWLGPRLFEHFKDENNRLILDGTRDDYLTQLHGKLKKTAVGKPDLLDVIVWLERNFDFLQ